MDKINKIIAWIQNANNDYCDCNGVCDTEKMVEDIQKEFNVDSDLAWELTNDYAENMDMFYESDGWDGDWNDGF